MIKNREARRKARNPLGHRNFFTKRYKSEKMKKNVRVFHETMRQVNSMSLDEFVGA